MKWTEDQKKSIFAPPAQIVVSAAAGSGKTQVLTSRIIERIKNSASPVSVDKLLIVTFTKAAAAEMKERIGKALRNAAKEESDKAVRDHLRKQLSLLGSAHICTIDSFCFDVVKQNFFKANLPSDIAIGENGERSLLKLAALEETVNALYCALERSKGASLSEENSKCASIAESYFTDKDELALILNGFEALTNTCSYDKRDSEFSENILGGGDYTTMISSLYDKAQSAAYPEKWLSEAADIYDCNKTEYSQTIAFNYSFSTCISEIKSAIKTLSDLAGISEANGVGYETTLREDAEALSSLLAADGYDDLHSAYISAVIFQRIKGKNKECDALLAEQIKNTRTKIKDSLNSTLKTMLEFTLEECNTLKTQLYPQIKALCCAAILLGQIYFDKMTARKIIDFSTCEHLALRLISEDGKTLTEVGESLKNKFDEIYIDEIQDSNDLQDMLFSLISKGRTFMVGDVKQSIYGFRNADPSIFMQKCDEASFDEASKKRKIFLSKNFRSAKSVINGVNSIFDVIMTPDVCGIDYKKEHRLDFGTDFMPESVPNEKCTVALIEESGNSAQQLYNEAVYIARTIKEMINAKRTVWDKETGVIRPIEYSDIAILSRSVKSSAKRFELAFAQFGIPCYIDGNNDLYETNEVGQILEILKLIDNAQSDISLACALRSPMFMFDENELLEIKIQSKESFCDAFYGICNGKYSVSTALMRKCKHFMGYLKSWRNASGFVSVEELIRRIYTDTGIYSIVLSFPDGQMRRANLDLLLEKAEEFERSSYNGLFNFVNYVQKIKKTSENVSEAKAVSEKMNVVRIMTIHKSKGLEFPVVFLASCGKKYRSLSLGAGGLILSSRAGIGMNVINPLLRCKYKSPIQTALISMAEKDNAAEEMRLFYVALTRAREKLYVVATMRDYSAFENLQQSIIPTLSPKDILSCKSHIALLALAYARGGDKYWEVTEIPATEEEFNTESTFEFESIFKENPKISQMLDFEYPYHDSVNLPNKASVSYLKSFDINLAPSSDGKITLLNTPSCKRVSLSKPDFLKEKESGTFYGSAHHKVLQYLDYNGDSVEKQCDNLLSRGILTNEERNIISIDKIEGLMASDLGIRLKNAQKLYREEPFVISVSANEIDPMLPKDETICVQGIIDCYFETENEVVLVDYKTDKYDLPSEIAERYKKQLYYYEKALKSKCKDKVIQKYLYLLHKNDIIEL